MTYANESLERECRGAAQRGGAGFGVAGVAGAVEPTVAAPGNGGRADADAVRSARGRRVSAPDIAGRTGRAGEDAAALDDAGDRCAGRARAARTGTASRRPATGHVVRYRSRVGGA